MSITLDDKSVDVFKLYDEMTIAYSKDIEGYKTLIKAIEAMISQKEEMLQDIKDNTVALVKTSIEIAVSQKEPVRKKRRKLKSAGVDVVEAVAAEKEIDTGEAVIEIATTPVEVQPQEIIPAIIEQVQKPRAPRQKKEAGKGKVKKVAKPEKARQAIRKNC